MKYEVTIINRSPNNLAIYYMEPSGEKFVAYILNNTTQTVKIPYTTAAREMRLYNGGPVAASLIKTISWDGSNPVYIHTNNTFTMETGHASTEEMSQPWKEEVAEFNSGFFGTLAVGIPFFLILIFRSIGKRV